MSPLDLIRSNRDGAMSLTKVAALTAHISAAVMFIRLQWSEPFNETLWLVYLGATVFHAVYDKTAAQVKAYKERELGELRDERVTSDVQALKP
jgi:hypothetical protein